MDRRRMMSGKKFRVKYSLNMSSAYSYIQLNGEGEKLTGSGEIEVRSGDYVLCYAYSNSGSYIEKDGTVVAENTSHGSAEYMFYPKSDAKIEIRSGSDIVGTHVVITSV